MWISGELPMKPLFSISSRPLGFIFGVEISEEDAPFIEGNSGTPSSTFDVPVDSRYAGSAIGATLVVLTILCFGAFAKIFVAIVQRIAVTMISYLSIRETKYCVVKKYLIGSCRSLPYGVKRLGRVVPCSVPRIGRKLGITMSRDNRHLSLCQWDVADRLILRLNNRLAPHATFGHDLTSNEIAAIQPLAYCTMGVF